MFLARLIFCLLHVRLSSKRKRRGKEIGGRTSNSKKIKELIGFQKAFSSYARLYDRFPFKKFVYLQIGNSWGKGREDEPGTPTDITQHPNEHDSEDVKF